MHKNTYKIKAAFSCNESFTNSINELKPFLGFDLKKIDLVNEISLINSTNEILIVDSSCTGKVPFDKINIPTVLILKQNEKNEVEKKFDATIKLPLNITQFNRAIIDLSQKYKFDKNSLVKVKNYILDKNSRLLKKNKNSVKVKEKEMRKTTGMNMDHPLQMITF